MTTPAPSAESPSTIPEVTAPSPATDAPAFGWTAYAERINGRFAMVGFVALLVLELVTQQTFFTWLGF
jgi:hypothetical protein